jgi:hypothetical protein
LRFAQVSVAQYFAVDYHNVYKYVTDTRGATPRTYVLYQARLAASASPAEGDGCACHARPAPASPPARRARATQRQ